MGYSMFNTTKRITLLFIVPFLFYRNPPNIWIKIIQIAIQMEFLLVTKYLDTDRNLHLDLNNFAPCKWGIYDNRF